jgi:hypothetical protein
VPYYTTILPRGKAACAASAQGAITPPVGGLR